ncbi:MAG TPA: nitrile hydratase subunit beta [Pseudolabrys sp.]|jgi:nitrile hydratase|nr:nitrile hydratase subunit beta [Pseudolabrys sp.]
MNGAADMGGMHGYGPVVREENEPVFHADWEGVSFALNMATGVAKLWNLDAFRFQRESIPPPEYTNLSYYGLWTRTLELMMLKYGVATPEELAAGHATSRPKKTPRPVTAADVAEMVRCGSPYERPAPAPARFKVGDKVRAKNMHPKTHTRLPRYARGRAGEVVRIVGCHVFPDSHASNLGEDPHWLYTVRFDGRELWGADSDPSVRVCIEAWEPYLEPLR